MTKARNRVWGMGGVATFTLILVWFGIHAYHDWFAAPDYATALPFILVSAINTVPTVYVLFNAPRYFRFHKIQKLLEERTYEGTTVFERLMPDGTIVVLSLGEKYYTLTEFSPDGSAKKRHISNTWMFGTTNPMEEIPYVDAETEAEFIFPVLYRTDREWLTQTLQALPPSRPTRP